MKKVLITGAGGAAAISVYKSLRESHVEIYMADMCDKAPGLYLVEQECRVLLPKAKDENFVEKLILICQSLNIDVLYPTVDDELLPIANNSEAFKNEGIYVAISSQSSLEKCLDKYELMQTCKDHIPLGQFAIFDDNFTASNWTYPLILKPRSGAGSRGIVLVNNQEQIDKLPRDPLMLVQEYLPGTEYSVDIYINQNGQCMSAVPRERIKVDSGIAIVSKTSIDSELSNLAKQAALATGLTGVANIQFRRDALGVAKLLEINPRFSGTMPLTIAAGADMPKMVLKEAAQESLETIEHTELAVIRYLEEKFISIDELR